MEAMATASGESTTPVCSAATSIEVTPDSESSSIPPGAVLWPLATYVHSPVSVRLVLQMNQICTNYQLHCPVQHSFSHLIVIQATKW